MQLRPKQVRGEAERLSDFSQSCVAGCFGCCNLQLVCIENLLLRSLAATGMAGDGEEEEEEEATAKAKTIYGIAAIVANCKCCGKQVN